MSNIGQFYNGLSTQEQEKIDGMIKEGRIDEVAELVSHLFDIEQTRYLEDELFYEESEDGMVRVCLEKNQVIIELITMMADDPKYRFQMGVLLSTMDFSDLPKKLKKKVDPEKVENNFQLLLKNRNWYLCEDAETRMVEALYNGSVILVDNCLLVKHKGKLSGLCLKTFTTKKGFTFIEGNWYSPVDPGTRKKIQQAYENRQSSIFTDSDCDWVLMRAIEDLDEERRADELLNEVKRVIFTTNEWETRKASFKLEPN